IRPPGRESQQRLGSQTREEVGPAASSVRRPRVLSRARGLSVRSNGREGGSPGRRSDFRRRFPPRSTAMKKSMIAALAVGFVGFVATARAADDSPVGTWKFSQPTRGGQSREVTMKLKLDGEKLTGTVTSGQNNDMETEITDGKFKGGE